MPKSPLSRRATRTTLNGMPRVDARIQCVHFRIFISEFSKAKNRKMLLSTMMVTVIAIGMTVPSQGFVHVPTSMLSRGGLLARTASSCPRRISAGGALGSRCSADANIWRTNERVSRCMHTCVQIFAHVHTHVCSANRISRCS